MDGYLKIKTKIDNKDVDKGITELENKIKKLQEDNMNQSQKQDSLQEEINKYEEMCNQADAYRQKLKDLEMQRKSLFTNGNLKSSQLPQYESTIAEIEQSKAAQTRLNSEIDKQAPKIDKVYSKLSQIKAKQEENNQKISEYKQKIEQINLNKVQNSLNTVGKNVQNQIGKLGKMAMAVIGIRTAWGAVRSVISMVSQYNSQVSADLEYMRYCIASMLVPVVQGLIKLLYTVLSYVNAIASAWFGINLFGNASVKNFKKMQSSAGGTAKSVKEIAKSLQGFDEMNVVQDNSNTDGGGSGGGVSTPSMDLSGIQGEVPAWLQWIIDNKDLILSVLAGITAGVIALKFGLNGIKALGIGIMVAGIVYTIQSLIKYLNNPSWNNFGKIIQGIGVAIIGLGILIGSVPVAVAGAIVLIIGTIVKYWEQIKSFFQKGIDWLIGKSDWVHEMFGDTIGNIYDMFVKNLQLILDVFDNVFKMIKGIFDGLITFIKGVFTGNWKQAWEGIKQIFLSIWEGIKGVFISVFNFIKSMVVNVAKTTGNIISNTFKAVVNAVLRTIENILNSPIRAINGLIGIINAVPRY